MVLNPVSWLLALIVIGAIRVVSWNAFLACSTFRSQNVWSGITAMCDNLMLLVLGAFCMELYRTVLSWWQVLIFAFAILCSTRLSSLPRVIANLVRQLFRRRSNP